MNGVLVSANAASVYHFIQDGSVHLAIYMPSIFLVELLKLRVVSKIYILPVGKCTLCCKKSIPPKLQQ